MFFGLYFCISLITQSSVFPWSTVSSVISIFLFVICGLMTLFGAFLAILTGPVDLPTIDDPYMIFVAVLFLFVLAIPYVMLIMGTIGLLIAVINLIVSKIISLYNSYNIEEQQEKSYLLIICSCLLGLILLPVAVLITFLFLLAYLLNFYFRIKLSLNPFQIHHILIFILLGRKQILSINIQQNN